MTAARAFAQIDVFTATPGLGNPVAVVLDAAGLSDEAMQRFARWTNLSETTFVLPPSASGADYAVRIFTPGGELPFAGHPTLGTCFAWLAAGGQPQAASRVVQQCAKGLIAIERAGPPGRERLAFAAPPSQGRALPPDMLAELAPALGLRPEQVLRARVLDNGPVWTALQLPSAAAVQALRPDHARLAALGHKVGVLGLRPAPQAPQEPLMDVRAFAAPIGVPEDPVTGSLNASLAQWLMAEGALPARYTAAQGQALGRDGRVYLERDAQGQIWVGGDCVAVIQGHAQV